VELRHFRVGLPRLLLLILSELVHQFDLEFSVFVFPKLVSARQLEELLNDQDHDILPVTIVETVNEFFDFVDFSICECGFDGLTVCSGLQAGFNFKIAFVLVAICRLVPLCFLALPFPFFLSFFTPLCGFGIVCTLLLSWPRDLSYFVQNVLFSLD
jgi:hypothetical protein